MNPLFVNKKEGPVKICSIPQLTLTPEQRQRIEKLISALESGGYEQHTGNLANRSENSDKRCYCVLGLACELSGLGNWNPGYRDEFEYVVDERSLFEKGYILIPESIQKYYGFPDSNGFACVLEGDDEIYITDLNDAGYDFPALAKILRFAIDGGYKV